LKKSIERKKFTDFMACKIMEFYALLDEQKTGEAYEVLSQICESLEKPANAIIKKALGGSYLYQEKEDLKSKLQVAIWANGLKPSLRWKKGRASVITWAMCILKKKILDLERAYYRKKKRKVRYLSLKVDSDGNIPEDVADKSPSAIEYLIREETVEKVRDAITKLPKKFGKILWKKHIEKMKSRQIALILGMSQTSIHRRLMEGNELLAKILGGGDMLME